jgi:hypothetical protein
VFHLDPLNDGFDVRRRDLEHRRCFVFNYLQSFQARQSNCERLGRLMLNLQQPGKFVQLSSDLLSCGYSVRFRASGGSMRPAICHGDVLTVGPVVPSNIAPGSVAVYRQFDRLLAHRVVRIDADGSGAPVFVLRGDAASDCDAPVAASQMLGEVVKVERRIWAIHRLAEMCLERLRTRV